MKISDILRMAADAFDARTSGAAPDTRLQNPAELQVAEIPGQETVEVVANVEEKPSPNGVTASEIGRAHV